MPEFMRIGSIKFFVYSREESRAHIHVRVQEYEAKIWLDDLSVAKTNASEHLTNKIVKLVTIHQEELLNCWSEFFGEEL